MTDTSALRAFIEARLADDERMANEAASGRSWGNLAIGPRWVTACADCSGSVEDADSGGTIVHDEGMPTAEQAQHIARHDPARVLREVAAKRAILALIERVEGLENLIDGEWPIGWPTDYPSMELLPLLAAAYVDHPDYRPEWAA